MDRTITLIRHGITAGNLEKRYIGITDEDLTIDGERDIASRHYPEADIIFSSPLLRCLRTAEIIYPMREVIVINDLKETNFGRFEGCNYLELAEDSDYQAWIDSGGEDAFPGGESRAEAMTRAMNGFNKILALSKDCSHITAVVHGGTIMAILSHIFGQDYYSYHVENGEGYTFDLSHNGLYSGLSFRSFTR